MSWPLGRLLGRDMLPESLAFPWPGPEGRKPCQRLDPEGLCQALPARKGQPVCSADPALGCMAHHWSSAQDTALTRLGLPWRCRELKAECQAVEARPASHSPGSQVTGEDRGREGSRMATGTASPETGEPRLQKVQPPPGSGPEPALLPPVPRAPKPGLGRPEASCGGTGAGPLQARQSPEVREGPGLGLSTHRSPHAGLSNGLAGPRPQL